MENLHSRYLLCFGLVILCLIVSSCYPSTPTLSPQVEQSTASYVTNTATLTPNPSPTITSTPTVMPTSTLIPTTSPIPTLEANWLTLPAPTISAKNIDRIQFQTKLALAGYRAWSPNNKFVAVGYRQRIALYNFKNLIEIKLQPEESEKAKEIAKYVNFTAIAFSPDSTMLVGAYDTHYGGNIIFGGGIWIWRTVDGKLLYSSSDDGVWADSLVFSPDGTTLALGQGSDIGLFDMQQLKPVRSWSANTWIIDDLAFSPDGKVLATVSRDNKFDLWNISDGSKYFESFGTKDDPNLIAGLSAVTFSPSGDYIAIGSTYGFIRLYQIDDKENIKEVKEWKADKQGSVNSLTFSPDETMLVSSSYSGVEFWSLPNCVSLRKLDEAGGEPKFSSDGTLLMIGGQFWTVK